MWHTIVIGSGIGGLVAGAALARHGHRVLLLEQHHTAGGQTQTFRRQQWVFATGVHYLGGVGPQPGSDGQFGRLLDWLCGGTLRFAESANPYDIVHLPGGFEFGIEHPEAAYRTALEARFPQHRHEIAAWFDACAAARQAASTLMAQHAMPGWMGMALRLVRGGQAERWARHTLADELAKIADPQLRAVLGARWGDYGAPPAWAPFAEHALVTGSYNGGAWYPVGGPAQFAQRLVPVIEAAGGQVVLQADVQRLIALDGHISGVEYRHGGSLQHAAAGHVISAMGARNTAAALPAGVATDWREAVEALAPGVGFVALYLGLEGDIAAAGASSANHWIYEGEDIGRLWQHPADEDAPGLFVSFPSLKDPAWVGPPVAEVLALADSAAFAPWLHPTNAEGVDGAEDYAAFKDWIAARLRAQFERHFPQLAPLIRYHEAATPLTQRRYVRTPEGSMYGLEMTAARLTSPTLHLRTPLPGLLLAGQDVLGPGVLPSGMAGLLAAATIEPRVWREFGR